MNLGDLKRIDKLPHLSSYSINQLLTALSLYEPILITTNDVELITSEDISSVCVSKDVQTLHEFCLTEKTLMMPCPKCKDDRPFEQTKAWEPRLTPSSSKVKKPKELDSTLRISLPPTDEIREVHNIFDSKPNSPHYNFGTNRLADVDQSEFREYSWNCYVDECSHKCKLGILQFIGEFRKDYICTLEKSHKGFVDFLILPAVTGEPDEMEQYWARQYEAAAKNPDTVLSRTTDEECAEKLYHKHFDSLLLVKVGQYPSLKELQIYDTKKYRKILGKNYDDYTLALALYADGVGAGSFVYLRRILECFVDEVHLECVKQCNDAVASGSGVAFNEEEYGIRRFNEKIDYLEQVHHKTIIPAELNEIRNKIYGVLSKGVHQSTEQECLHLFPSAKYIIDSLIEEKIHQKERAERLAIAKKAFQEQ